MQNSGLDIKIWASKSGVTRTETRLIPTLGIRWTVVDEGASAAFKRRVDDWMSHYADGQAVAEPLLVDLGSLPLFTQAVLTALQEIPFGTTTTYGALARMLGNPDASRAVGCACGRNPALLFVPCHRVLAANQGLGGFSSGLSLKRWLLAHEGVKGLKL